MMFIAIKNKVEGAKAALIGILILFATFIGEIFYQNELIIFSSVSPILIFPFGVFLFLFFQSYLLSQRFSQAFFSVERLSNNLLKLKELRSRVVCKNM